MEISGVGTTMCLVVAVNAMSGEHGANLARGGYGFIIGDGRLHHPGRQMIFEAYCARQIQKVVTISPEYQFIANPAYNRDRGPLNVLSLRLYAERCTLHGIGDAEGSEYH